MENLILKVNVGSMEKKVKISCLSSFPRNTAYALPKGSESDVLSYIPFHVASVRNLASGGPDSGPASDSKIQNLRGLELKTSSVIWRSNDKVIACYLTSGRPGSEC